MFVSQSSLHLMTHKCRLLKSVGMWGTWIWIPWCYEESCLICFMLDRCLWAGQWMKMNHVVKPKLGKYIYFPLGLIVLTFSIVTELKKKKKCIEYRYIDRGYFPILYGDTEILFIYLFIYLLICFSFLWSLDFFSLRLKVSCFILQTETTKMTNFKFNFKRNF